MDRITTDTEDQIAALEDLNSYYLRAVEEANVAWFERNLAADFCNTNTDGSFLDRAGFIAQIARGSPVTEIKGHDVIVRLLGDFAIVHARTTFKLPGGAPGHGRYTDDWQWRDGRWQCVSAHVARIAT